jgi:hypothetical protein
MASRQGDDARLEFTVIREQHVSALFPQLLIILTYWVSTIPPAQAVGAVSIGYVTSVVTGQPDVYRSYFLLEE